MTEERLREVFDLVKDQSNWKNPINQVVKKGEATPTEIVDAVIHFTGSIPYIGASSHGDLHVVADGYYLTIGA